MLQPALPISTALQCKAPVDRIRSTPHIRVMIPLSVLDLSPIVEGGDAAQSLRNSLDLARHADRWGYRRYWLAEHHNSAGIASAATATMCLHSFRIDTLQEWTFGIGKLTDSKRQSARS